MRLVDRPSYQYCLELEELEHVTFAPWAEFDRLIELWVAQELIEVELAYRWKDVPGRIFCKDRLVQLRVIMELAAFKWIAVKEIQDIYK